LFHFVPLLLQLLRAFQLLSKKFPGGLPLDPRYREGATPFQTFPQHSRVPGGGANAPDVETSAH